MIDGQNNHHRHGDNHRQHVENHHSQDDRRFVEMYQRAVSQHDFHARSWLQQQTRRAMLHSLRNHPFYSRIQRQQNEEHYLAQAYEQFWQKADAHSPLQSRPAIMHCLHALLNGVLLEASRSHPQTPLSGTQTDSHRLWARIQAVLPDERERRIAYLLYHCGLHPAEIVRAYPQEFGDMQEIHRVRRVIIDRFKLSR